MKVPAPVPPLATANVPLPALPIFKAVIAEPLPSILVAVNKEVDVVHFKPVDCEKALVVLPISNKSAVKVPAPVPPLATANVPLLALSIFITKDDPFKLVNREPLPEKLVAVNKELDEVHVKPGF